MKTLAIAVEHHQAGRLTQAEPLYRRILQADPGCADAWHLLGLLLHQAGQSEVAVEYINRAIALQPKNGVYHKNLAVVYQKTGRLAEAADRYRAVLELNPQQAEIHYKLALVLRQLGQVEAAISGFQAVLELQPDNIQANYNLGVLFAGQEQFERAITHFQQTLHLQPDFAKAYNNLGVALDRTNRLDAAIANYRQALQRRPDYVEALNNLGVALGKQGEVDEAIACLKQAVHLNPAYVEAHFNLGNKFRALGDLEQAAASYQQVLHLWPGHVGAQNNLGVIFLTQGRLHPAEKLFRQVLNARPNEAEACYNLGVVLKEKDEIEPARELYRQALGLKPEKILWKLERDMLCPAIMPTRQAIERWRREFADALDNYPPGGINLTALLPDIPASKAQPPFALHYQGQNDCFIKAKYAARFAVAGQASGALKPHPETGASTGKLRLGFFVSFKNEGLFLKLMGGVINQLNPADFEVTIIGLAKSLGFSRARIQNDAVSYLPITLDLKLAVQKIRAANFNLIYYWEVGSNAVNYFLPFFRLAPVQCTSWGVTETTGVPAIDYYISSRFFEAEGAAAHYTETLVQLDTPLSIYTRPEMPANLRTRDYFNLAKEAHLYLCLQSRRKFHPDFDKLVAQILRRDPAGQLVLVSRESQTRHDQLWLTRLQTIAPDIVGRVQFLPRQDYQEYLNLIAVADVLLDTLYFCGGMTTYDSLAVGTPLVTLPGEFMRGRMTLGCYQQMGLPDCVAAGPDDYVELALRLGTGRAYRNAIKAKILAANAALYKNKAVARAYEQFFKQAIETAQSD